MNYSVLENNITYKKIVSFLFFLFVLIISRCGFSQTITIFPHEYLPPFFILVDKQKQTLYMTKYKDFTIYFQKREPCSTGANKGDKLRQGDEKTPEGIYFFSKKIKNPPNPILYGSLAFPLNYPNP